MPTATLRARPSVSLSDTWNRMGGSASTGWSTAVAAYGRRKRKRPPRRPSVAGERQTASEILTTFSRLDRRLLEAFVDLFAIQRSGIPVGRRKMEGERGRDTGLVG